MDDNQFSSEDFETMGELCSLCAHIVLKCLYLARRGMDRETRWQEQSRSAMELAVGDCSKRWFTSCHTKDFRQFGFVGHDIRDR